MNTLKRIAHRIREALRVLVLIWAAFRWGYNGAEVVEAWEPLTPEAQAECDACFAEDGK